MNKKRYLLIIWIITLICIIAGILIHFGGLFTGVSFFHYSTTNGKFVTDVQSYGNVDVGEMTIDADIADIDISYGDKLEVTSIYPKKYLPKVTYKDGVLNIKESYNKVANLEPNVMNEDRYSMRIVIPNDIVIKNTNIELNLGDVHINDVDSEKLFIDNKLGDIKIKSAEGKNADISLSLGDLHLDNSKYDAVDVNNDLGDVNLDGDYADMDLACSMGSVKVRSTGKANKVKAVNDLGDIELDGDFDIIDAYCDAGDIDITTKGEVDKNKITARCDLGDVTVNGEDY